MNENPIPIVAAPGISAPQPPTTATFAAPPPKPPSKSHSLGKITAATIGVIALVTGAAYAIQNRGIPAIGIGSSTVSYKLNPVRAKELAAGYNELLSIGPRNFLKNPAPGDSLFYSLADLNGDREPELLIAGDNKQGEAVLVAFTGKPHNPTPDPQRYTYWWDDEESNDTSTAEIADGFDACAFFTWENTKAKELLESFIVPSPKGSSTGIKIPAAPKEDFLKEIEFFFKGQIPEYVDSPGAGDPGYISGLSYYTPVVANPLPYRAIDGTLQEASPKDFKNKHLKVLSASDKSLLRELETNADPSVPLPNDSTLFGFWRYQLQNLDQVNLPDGILGEHSQWQITGVAVSDINHDTWPELLIKANEVLDDKQVPSVFVFTRDRNDEQVYVATFPDGTTINFPGATFGYSTDGIVARHREGNEIVFTHFGLEGHELKTSSDTWSTSNSSVDFNESLYWGPESSIPSGKFQAVKDWDDFDIKDYGPSLNILSSYRLFLPLGPAQRAQ